jgi:membrane protease YdiL (CAAX protease family)
MQQHPVAMDSPEKKRRVVILPLTIISYVIALILEFKKPHVDTPAASALGGVIAIMVVPIFITWLITFRWRRLLHEDIFHWRRKYRATFFVTWFFWAGICVLGQVVQPYVK